MSNSNTMKIGQWNLPDDWTRSELLSTLSNMSTHGIPMAPYETSKVFPPISATPTTGPVSHLNTNLTPLEIKNILRETDLPLRTLNMSMSTIKVNTFESKDGGLAFVGLCVFCYVFVFHMIGWCADRRKLPQSSPGVIGPMQENHSSASSSYSHYHPQSAVDECYSSINNPLYDNDRAPAYSVLPFRTIHTDRPPRYNDLAVVIDIPEVETPPPSYTQVLAS